MNDAQSVSGRVVLDERTCDLLASIISSTDIPPDEEEVSFQSWPRELVGNLYLAVVAICHQTSPRGSLPLEGSVKGRLLRGWDYLLSKFAASAQEDPSIVMPASWADTTASGLLTIFRDPLFGDRLSDPEGRALLLRDLGAQMVRRGWKYADDIYAVSDNTISTGQSGLLDLIAAFHAYSDPVRKKSLFFLALMKNSGLWTYRDNASLGPPVDYHEVRGHLRLGTIRIVDKILLRKVVTGSAVTKEEDIEIRAATFQAIIRVSEKSGLRDPSRLHYFFWNLFRSICRREHPQCFSIVDASLLPEKYKLSVGISSTPRCPFSAICASAGRLNPVWEHVFESDYY